MNDADKQSSHAEAPGGHATTDLPLQAQLMGSLALVLVLSAVAGVIGYASYDSTTLENGLRAKSTVYATNLTQQLYGAVAMNDLMQAEQALEPLVNDRNVHGVAVYAPSGRRIAGHGVYPVSLAAGEQVKPADDRVMLTMRDIAVGYGAPGRLYLALSTEHIAQARFRAAQFPAMTTAVVLLFAILLALAHSFSVMMSEVVRLFEERRQMERTEKERLEKLVSERTRDLTLVVEGTQAIPFALDVEDGHFEYIGPQGPQRLGFSHGCLEHRGQGRARLPAEQPVQTEGQQQRPKGERSAGTATPRLQRGPVEADRLPRPAHAARPQRHGAQQDRRQQVRQLRDRSVGADARRETRRPALGGEL